MATAAVIGLSSGKRLLSSTFYYSDLTEKPFNVYDHRLTHYQIASTKNGITAKKSSNYGPRFPSSNRNTRSIKALKEHVDAASASSTAVTWSKTFNDIEEDSSDLDYSVEALLLLQKSLLEKQWNLSFERTISSDSSSINSQKKIPVTCSGLSARKRRVNTRRKTLSQSKSIVQASTFKHLKSAVSPELLQNRLKGYVKGVVSEELLTHKEVVHLSKIIKAGLSMEEHKSR